MTRRPEMKLISLCLAPAITLFGLALPYAHPGGKCAESRMMLAAQPNQVTIE
jgi:hypothetical protein